MGSDCISSWLLLIFLLSNLVVEYSILKETRKPRKSNMNCCVFSRRFLKWTASSEFGTYRLCEQRRFRRACASAQSRQNLRCSLIQAVSQEEPSDRKPDPWPLWMVGHAHLKFNMTECSKTQIRLTGLKLLFRMSCLLSAPLTENWKRHLSPVKRICVFEHSVMTNFNCACPDIQTWLSACAFLLKAVLISCVHFPFGILSVCKHNYDGKSLSLWKLYLQWFESRTAERFRNTQR